MTETEMMDETERQQFTEFKKRLSLQAAQAQVGKLEFNLAEAGAEKSILKRACQDANALKLGAICVLPNMVKTCSVYLGRQSPTSVIACISYPHGGDLTKLKVAAIKNAVKDGAKEVEVTVPIALAKENNWSYIKREFKKLKKAAKKCILRINAESRYLSQEEVTKICLIAADCGITSIKTASDADSISVVYSAVKDRCTIKADNVNTVTDMVNAVGIGAGIIGSRNAVDLARLVLQNYEL